MVIRLLACVAPLRRWSSRSVRGVLTLAVATSLMCALVPMASAEETDFEDEDARFELVYTGEFIDQENQPITGVFPLVFKLYEKEKGGKAIWSESHFVSVVDGGYTMSLGRETSLPPQAAEGTVFLAVEIDGSEIVRQPITAKLASEEVRIGGPSLTAGTSQYAEQAGDAETLGGFAPDEFAPASVVEKVDRHIRDKDLHGGGGGGGGGAALGSKDFKSDYAGGSGGKAYTLSCPEGYVVTGVEGRSGAVLDSLRLVCTQLQ